MVGGESFPRRGLSGFKVGLSHTTRMLGDAGAGFQPKRVASCAMDSIPFFLYHKTLS
jgi:hypothetical protein